MLVTPTPAASLAAILRPHHAEIDELWRRLGHLETTYPGFTSWFWHKVAPGIETGERRVFTRVRSAGMDGAVIAKSDGQERKLCTIWVDPSARGEGVASRLVDEAREWLEDPHPLLTVPDHRLAELSPLLRRRGFELTERIPSCYREGRTEYVFNGRLVPHLNA